MADNTTLNPGTGGDVIVTEQPGGTGPKIPVSKIYTGALDVNGGPVTSTNPFDIRISDATNTASVKAASTAAIATDKALVVAISPNNSIAVTGTFWQTTQPVSGTITANIGTSGSLALDATLTGGTQRTKITDGTNNAAVKAASTSASGTDPSLVVQISPLTGTLSTSVTSSTLPTGAATSANQTTLGSQTTKINDGTNTAAVKAASTAAATTDPALVVAVSPNNSIAVTGTFWQATQPVSGTFWQTTQPVSIAATVVTTQQTASAGITSVAASVTSVTVLASNSGRKGAAVYNDSTSILYLALASSSSTTTFTIKMQSGDYYEVPFGYTGIITGIWAAANGSSRATEVT